MWSPTRQGCGGGGETKVIGGVVTVKVCVVVFLVVRCSLFWVLGFGFWGWGGECRWMRSDFYVLMRFRLFSFFFILFALPFEKPPIKSNTQTLTPQPTTQMVPTTSTAAPTPPTHFADSNAPGKIMFISQPPSLPSACFGGLMAARAKVLGAAGVVVNGRFRDIGEIRGLGLPVSFFALGYFQGDIVVRKGLTRLHTPAVRA